MFLLPQSIPVRCGTRLDSDFHRTYLSVDGAMILFCDILIVAALSVFAAAMLIGFWALMVAFVFNDSVDDAITKFFYFKNLWLVLMAISVLLGLVSQVTSQFFLAGTT